MHRKYYLSIFLVLTSCAQQQAMNQLGQGKQCWAMVKERYYAVSPGGEAAWYLSDAEPQLADFQNRARATKVEAQQLAHLTEAYDQCYAPAMQPTGDVRYDNLIRTASTATTLTYIELAKYANREITRGEYFQRYAAIKAGFDNSKNQQIANIQQDRAAARRKFAHALAVASQNMQKRNENLRQAVIEANDDILREHNRQYNASMAENNRQRELQDMEQRHRNEMAEAERERKKAEAEQQQAEWERQRLETENRRISRGY